MLFSYPPTHSFVELIHLFHRPIPCFALVRRFLLPRSTRTHLVIGFDLPSQLRLNPYLALFFHWLRARRERNHTPVENNNNKHVFMIILYGSG
jgi:hypothetical protein